MSRGNTQFAGFYSPNTTPVPDQLFDELLAELSGAEVKVLLYICRRTFGFKKQRDPISLNQMLTGIRRRNGTHLDRGVGLSRPTLIKALKSLKERGCIIAERRQSPIAGNQTTIYQLRILTAQTPSSKTELGVVSNFNQGVKVFRQPLVQKLNQQETEKQQTDQTVNVNGQEKNKKSPSTHPVKSLPELMQPKEKSELIANDILAQLGDRHSHNFYRLVASRIPEATIRQVLAEIQADGAEYPARLFTHRITDYAKNNQQSHPKTTPKVRQDSWTPIADTIANR